MSKIVKKCKKNKMIKDILIMSLRKICLLFKPKMTKVTMMVRMYMKIFKATRKRMLK